MSSEPIRQAGIRKGVYQFMPRWRVGYRYDRLKFGTVNNGIVNSGLGPARPPIFRCWRLMLRRATR